MAACGRGEASLIQGRDAARLGRSDDVETLLARAQAYALGGLPDRSLPLYRRIVEIDPLNQGAHWHLVVATLFAGQFEDAVDIGNVYLQRFGDDQEIHALLGASYQLLGHHERAQEHYEKAIDLEMLSSSSATPYALVWAGSFFDQIGERERAEEVWRRGVELLEPKLEAYPDNIRMRLYLAGFYGLLGEQSFSIEEERALSANIIPWGYEHLAAVHAKRGETERAIDLLRAALQQGLIHPQWKNDLWVITSAPSIESEAFAEFLAEFEAEEQRLRELY